MRLGRHKTEENEAEELIVQNEAGEAAEEEAAQQTAEEQTADRAKEDAEIDLSKLKKKDLLEIMLRQGEEIDALRAQVADLEAQLENRIFEINKVGSIAEASLAVTKIFEEAEKAARIYLENIRSKVK